MHAPMYVAPSTLTLPEAPPSTTETTEILKQILEVQRDQLALQRSHQAAQDGPSRWRSFLTRWETEFPNIAADCKGILPRLERSYLTMIREMIDRLNDADPDDLDNEFALGEFLDRYGIRLSQLGNILGQIGPLAEAAPVRTEEPPSA